MEVCQNGTLFPFRDHGTEQDAGYEEDKTEGSNQQKTPCFEKSSFAVERWWPIRLRQGCWETLAALRAVECIHVCSPGFCSRLSVNTSFCSSKVADDFWERSYLGILSFQQINLCFYRELCKGSLGLTEAEDTAIIHYNKLSRTTVYARTA